MTFKNMSFELNGWMSSLGGSLYSLQRDSMLCDVTIQTSCGGNLHVHSVILAAGSSVLMNTMITQIKSGFKLAAVTINSEFDMDVWLPLVKFLYTGKLDVDLQILPQLLKLTKMLQVDKLVSVLKSAEDKGDFGENISITFQQPSDLHTFFSSQFQVDKDTNSEEQKRNENSCKKARVCVKNRSDKLIGNANKIMEQSLQVEINEMGLGRTTTIENDDTPPEIMSTDKKLESETNTERYEGPTISDLEDLLLIDSDTKLMSSSDNMTKEGEKPIQNTDSRDYSQPTENENSTCKNSSEPSFITTNIYKCTFCSQTFQSFQSLVLHSDLCQNFDMDVEDGDGIVKLSDSKMNIEEKLLKAIEIKPADLKCSDSDDDDLLESDAVSHGSDSNGLSSQDKFPLFENNKDICEPKKDNMGENATLEKQFFNGALVNSEPLFFDRNVKEIDFNISEGKHLSKEWNAESCQEIYNKSLEENAKTDMEVENDTSSMKENIADEAKNIKTINKNKISSNSFIVKRNVGGDKEKLVNFCCDICGAGLTSKLTMREHMKLHSSEEKTYQCHKCLKSFQTKRYLCRHEKFVHDKNSKLFSCDLCEKVFHVKSHLTTHLKYDHCEDPKSEALNRCGQCNKTFRYPILLKQHLATHSNDLQFTCELCDKGFLTKHYLDRHMLSHVDVQPWVCKQCDKRFKYKSSLAHHSQTTCSKASKAEDISFPCELCTRVFNEKKNLKAHVKTVHLGVKQYKCNICQRSFSRNSTLKSHIYNIHEKEDVVAKSAKAQASSIKTTIRVVDGFGKPVKNHYNQDTISKNSVKEENSEAHEETLYNAQKQDDPSSLPIMMIVNKFVKIQPKLPEPEVIVPTNDQEIDSKENIEMMEPMLEQQQQQQQQQSEECSDEMLQLDNVMDGDLPHILNEPGTIDNDGETLIKPLSVKLSGIVPLPEVMSPSPPTPHHETESKHNIITTTVEPNVSQCHMDGALSVANTIVSNVQGLQFVNTTDSNSMNIAPGDQQQLCGINIPQLSNITDDPMDIQIQQPLNLSIGQNQMDLTQTGNLNFHHHHANNLVSAPNISHVSIAHFTHAQPIFVKSLSSSSVVITNTGPPTKNFDNDPDDRERNELYFVDQSIENQSNDLSILNTTEIGSDDSYVKNKLDYSLFSLSSLGKTPDKL